MKSWPKGIYLEASVLFNLPMQIVNAQIEHLKELSESLHTQIFIPEASFQEWIPKRKEAVAKFIRNVEKGISDLSNLFNYVPKFDWEKDKKGMIDDTEAFTKKILDDNKISIIATPKIDVRILLDMSVNKIRPFEEGKEKGFRDSINLLTVLRYAQDQERGSHVFVTADDVYTHEDITSLAKKQEVELIVIPSISEAISTLENFVKDVSATIATYKKNILEIFLLENVDKVSEYIKQNGEFTPPFLNKDYKLGIRPRIENIDEIQVMGIDSITRGVLPKGTIEGKVKISFTAKTRFNIRVKEIPPRPEFRFKYGEKVSPLIATVPVRLSNREPQTLNKITEISIPIEGSVTLKREKDPEGYLEDKYSDLDIDNIIIR